MKGPYVNEDGDLWIERGSCSWNEAQREAKGYLVGEFSADAIEYVGAESGVRVSDENEYVHWDEEDCREIAEDGLPEGEELPADWRPCCRTVEAWHFRAVIR